MTANFRPPVPAKRVSGSGYANRGVPPFAGPRRAVPSISGLIAFEATARYLSFSDAARELALTQGAVSKRVRQLENVVGVTLLGRSRHKVTLTEFGRRYLVDVRRLLGEVEAATQSLQACSGRPSITVAAPHEIASYWLMPRLGEFLALHPEIAVNLVSWHPPDEAVQPFGFECAIHCVEEPSAGISVEILFEEQVVPVASPGFVAEHHASAPEDLLCLPLILQNERHGLWQDWFSSQGLDTEGRIDGSSHDCLSLVLEAALNGHGVALAPVHAARDLLHQGRLKTLFEAPLATDRTYVFSIHPAFARQAAVCRFRQWIAGKADARQ